MRRVLIAVAVAACASQGFPPGGPDDPNPPVLVDITPDSGALDVPRNREVLFQFDEVVNERPSGANELSGLVLISPREGEPRVDWKRTAIGVRGRRDWRDNTVYTVTLMAGVQDLRNNVRRAPATVVFSTGATLPDTRIAGVIFDWAANRPAAGALIEAITADSVVYIGVADSTGRFALPHLPAGTYRVQGFADPNRNHQLDPREAFDSTRVQLVDSARLELYAFVHDSVGARIEAVIPRDSMTLRVTFDKPLAPDQSLSTTQFRLVRGDSTPVRIAAASLATPDERAASDTVAPRPGVPLPRPPARPDTTAADTAAAPPRPRRPPPPTQVLLQLTLPVEPATTYLLSAFEIRNLLGVSTDSRRSFTTARAVPAAAPDTATPPGAPRPPRQ